MLRRRGSAKLLVLIEYSTVTVARTNLVQNAETKAIAFAEITWISQTIRRENSVDWWKSIDVHSLRQKDQR